jgi:hypothetical protein
MPSLTHQRCFNHSVREAVARCPECAKYFCRECVTEHDDRLICAACLKKLTRPPLTQQSWFIGVLRAAHCLAGVLVAWLFFYYIGRTLLSIPTTFHEGTMWKAGSAWEE